MNWLKHINLGPKLDRCLRHRRALLTLAVGCFGLYNQQAASVRTEQIYQDNVLAIEALTAVQKNLLLHARTLVRALTQVSNPQQQAETLERVRGYWSAEQQAWEQYMGTTANASEALLRDELLAQTPTYLRLTDSAMAQLRQGNISAAADLINGEVRSASKQFETTLDQLIQNNVEQAAQANSAAAKVAGGARVYVDRERHRACRGVCADRRLGVDEVDDRCDSSSAIAAAQRITSNDLSHPIAVEGSDEIAQLSTALRDMQETLRRTLQQISGLIVPAGGGVGRAYTR